MMEGLGIVTISDKAVKDLAAGLAKRTDGVAMLCERSKRDEAARLLNPSKNVRGVYLTRTNGKRVMDIYLFGRYGANAQDICKRLTARVEAELADMDIKLSSINVHYMGIKEK